MRDVTQADRIEAGAYRNTPQAPAERVDDVAKLREALRPFAEMPLPEQNGFTLYTREDIIAARAALQQTDQNR